MTDCNKVEIRYSLRPMT